MTKRAKRYIARQKKNRVIVQEYKGIPPVEQVLLGWKDLINSQKVDTNKQ